MSVPSRSRPLPRTMPLPGLGWVLLCALVATLWIAGGASRGDVAGQIVVRCVAAGTLIVAILFGRRPALRPVRPILVLLGAAFALALLQLVPLPPSWWQALPGRAALEAASRLIGEGQPWRPWSMVPGATVNAAASLIVPLAVLVLIASLPDREKAWLPGLLLVAVASATLIGLLQVSGAGFNNPLINDTPGDVSGSFANRNHFALFLALGCLLVPGWVFAGGRRAAWRGPVALGLLPLLALMILATGSRAGLAMGGLAVVIATGLSWRGMKAEFARRPRWVLPAAAAGIIGIVAIFVLLSIAAGKAVSIDRVLAVDTGQDMRSRGLPTVLAMIRTYFPWGSGLGGFDPVFRMHEPLALVKPTYFNHAHNDLLEVALDAGLPGLLLLAVTLGWWAWTSFGAWWGRRGAMHPDAGSDTRLLPRIGSAMLLLIGLASLFDYPLRTPTMMAFAVVAAVWLGAARRDRGASALPAADQHL